MHKSKTLQFFAEEVEVALKKGGTSLVLQVCRHITGGNPKISAFMTAKCVEWMLGKPVQTVRNEDVKPAMGLGFDEPRSDQSSRVC